MRLRWCEPRLRGGGGEAGAGGRRRAYAGVCGRMRAVADLGAGSSEQGAGDRAVEAVCDGAKARRGPAGRGRGVGWAVVGAKAAGQRAGVGGGGR